jgi:O-methyltransferase
MLKMVKNQILGLFNAFGYNLIRRPPAFAADEIDIIARVRPYTMTHDLQICGLIDAVRYLEANHLEGDVVECGVWRGGSMMAAAYTLLASGNTTRHLYLYDTFEGMSAPTDKDTALIDGQQAQELLRVAKNKETAEIWAYAGLQEVERNVGATTYPRDRLHFIKGKVEETIPRQIPSKIALLRLDTDWYESTKHELVHLYPRLVPNGVLIIDDYGHWAGSRQATDEYFAQLEFRPLLNRLDYSARLAIKPAL